MAFDEAKILLAITLHHLLIIHIAANSDSSFIFYIL